MSLPHAAVVDVEIEDEAWTASLPDASAIVRSAVLAALGPEPRGDIVVLLSGDEAIKDLNARFRGKAAPTNVLSFPAASAPWAHLGDIALAFGVCEAEARAQGKTLPDHLRHLVVHGVLHLLGYDHHDDREARVMESLERSILSGLGVADPYASDRTDGPLERTCRHG